jgi:hypothetical protein
MTTFTPLPSTILALSLLKIRDERNMADYKMPVESIPFAEKYAYEIIELCELADDAQNSMGLWSRADQNDAVRELLAASVSLYLDSCNRLDSLLEQINADRRAGSR